MVQPLIGLILMLITAAAAAPTGPSTAQNNLLIRVVGCASLQASTAKVTDLSTNNEYVVKIPKHFYGNVVALHVPTGYYTVRMVGSCATPAVLPPFVVLAERRREVEVYRGSGIGTLLTASIGLAGILPITQARAYVIGAHGRTDAKVLSDTYYFDNLEQSQYCLHIMDATDKPLFMTKLDLSSLSIYGVRIISLTAAALHSAFTGC